MSNGGRTNTNPLYVVCDHARLKKAISRLKKIAADADRDSFIVLDRIDELIAERNEAKAEQRASESLADGYREERDEEIQARKDVERRLNEVLESIAMEFGEEK